MTKAKTKKTAKPKLVRHADDHERWYTVTPVTERQTVETPWGEATAEVGTFIMTDSEDTTYQVICTQVDLDNHWTVDPVPSPPDPEPPIMDPPLPHTHPHLPGMKDDHDHGS